MTGRLQSPEAGAAPGRRLLGSRLRDARIRSKLGLILLIPLVAVVALAGARLLDGGQQATSAGRVHALAEVSAAAASLAHELHWERMAAARYLGGQTDGSDSFNEQASRTDERADAYRDARSALPSVPDLVGNRLDRLDEHLNSLSGIRQEILGDMPVTVSAALLRYEVVVSDLVAYQESVVQVTDNAELAESGRALAALSRAKVQMSEAQATAFVSLLDGVPDEEQVTSFLATQTGLQEALAAFAAAATPQQLLRVNSTLTGDAVVFAERAAAEVIRSEGTEPSITAQEAANAQGAVVNLVRLAESRLYDEHVAQAGDVLSAVRQQVIIESAAVLAVLALAITLAVVLARMLARSLGQLRQGALSVANRDLPETVARFSDPQNLGELTPAQVAAQVRDPIQLRSRDEVGQVAQAFNVVHQAAVRVSAEQAALRTSVSAMFLNLARRSQTLVDRMINQLDEIERNEDDPKRLSRLFSLDHLATRMRRNDENLLVLAGADSGPPRSENAAIPDILRAAQSEVEHYDRIEFGTVDADVSVAAPAVNDVVRLVAELFDNATRFSPPGTQVVAEARRLGDQLIIQVEDRGVGMSAEQTSQLNAWLAAPPAMELTTFRRMGLAVVGRLASRHGIRIELHSSPQSGTVAYAALPPRSLVLPPYRSRAFEVPDPRSPLPVEQEPPSPPVPSRHLGQLPQRSADVASHVARRRSVQTGAAESPPELPAPQQVPSNAAAVPQTGSTPPAPQVASTQQARTWQLPDRPVAGRPPEGMVRRRAVNLPPPDQTVEIPIFQEVEAVWFRSHGQLDLGPSEAEAASVRPATTTAASRTEAGNAGNTAVRTPEPSAASHGARISADEWKTAADEGWSAAEAAAQPPTDGATSSGLPKRVPQAQLVPGGVDEAASASTSSQRRSPDEVRGLLSAYHRGVQRGREHWGR